jgi:hypothetical protein
VVGALDPDTLIAQLAVTQRNRVARSQLLRLGLTPKQIEVRIRAGRLHPVLPGVYAVGSWAGGMRESLTAAWHYGGEESILAGRGAAAFWEIERFGHVDLISPRHRRGTRNIHFHRARLAPNEWIRRDGINVTTPARTLLDLMTLVPVSRAENALQEAEVLELVTPNDLINLLAANTGRAGAAALASLAGIDRPRPRGRVRSRNEIRFRAFLERNHGRWEEPELNALLTVGAHTYEVDALFRAARVAVEVDGRATHDTALRFETDRERDRHLTAYSWRPVRVTSRQLDRPRDLERDFDLILGAAAAGPPP